MIVAYRQYNKIPLRPQRYTPPSVARSTGREIQRFAERVRGMLGGTWLYWVPHLGSFMLGYEPKADGKIQGIRGFDVSTEFTDRLADDVVRSIRISERTTVDQHMRDMDNREKSRLHDAEEERDRNLYDMRHEIEDSIEYNETKHAFGNHHRWSSVVDGMKGNKDG